MKMPRLFTACLVLAAGTGSLSAGDLTIPNNFSANTTAVAAQVNANFDAVETAVDDNDARITSNTSDINTNASNIAINTSDINALSTQVTSLGTGYVSVHAATLMFGNSDISCHKRANINFFYVYDGVNCGSTNTALLYFPLNLPDGRVVTGFSCGIYDASADGFVDRLTFYRQPINTGAYTGISDLNTNSADTGYQILSSGTLSHTVDNSDAAYGIRIILVNSGVDFSTIGSSLRIIGCTVAYQP